MNDGDILNKKLGRRDFLKTVGSGIAIMAAGSSFSPRTSRAAKVIPWQWEPKEKKPEKVIFSAWKWGVETRYPRVAEEFQKDYGIPVDLALSSPGPHQFGKVFTLFGSGEQLDVFKSLITDRAGFLKDKMIDPITGMPGVDEYVNDFYPFVKQCLVVDGEVWGLPAFAETWDGHYNDIKYHEAGFKEHAEGEPFRDWDEFVEQCLKAKKDKVCEYPVLWPAGVGTEQLPGCWFGITHSMGGVIFDKQKKHALGPGSIARKSLEWMRKTFVDWKISDPRSLELRFIPQQKVWITGDYMYSLIIRDYYLSWGNDPAQSTIAGHTREFRMPEGRVLGAGHANVICTARKSKEWAYMLLQYVGGKTKSGESLVHDIQTATNGSNSGYKSHMENYFPTVATRWIPNGNMPVVIKSYEEATGILEVVPAMLEPWYRLWVDMLNVDVQKCLKGEITPDQCCDNLIKGVEEAKKKIAT